MPLPDHVFTTSPRSAAMKGRPWQRFLESREREPDRWYVFTDGSSSGSYAAVLVSPTGGVSSAVEWRPPTKTRNVGAEWNGLLLGLRIAPASCRVEVVVDLLWVHAQLIGVRKTVDPETKEQLAEARRLIEARRLDLILTHHDGHQKDESAFTLRNRQADGLCAQKALEIKDSAPRVGDVVEIIESTDGCSERADVRVLHPDRFEFEVLAPDGAHGRLRLADVGATWRMPPDGRKSSGGNESACLASASPAKRVKKTRIKNTGRRTKAKRNS